MSDLAGDRVLLRVFLPEEHDAFVASGMRARRVQAGTAVDNAAMLRVLERLGFVREGVLRRFFPSRDGGIDCALYAMTKDDWKERKDGWTPTS